MSLVEAQTLISPFLNQKEARCYLRLSYGDFSRLVKDGSIPSRRHGRRLLYAIEDLNSYSNATRRDSTPISLSKFQAARAKLMQQGSLKIEDHESHLGKVRDGNS